MKIGRRRLRRIYPQDFFTARWVLARYRAWLTPRGNILIWIMGIGAVLTQGSLFFFTYMVPCFTFALLITAFIFSFFFRPKVVACRLLPTFPTAGETLEYQAVIKNVGTRPLKDLSVCEGRVPYGLYVVSPHENQTHSIDWLGPGEEATVRLALKCNFRGIYELPPLVAGSSFPSGFVRWPIRASERNKLVVYPRFLSQSDFQVPFNRVYQPGGILLSSNVGNSNEFLSMREYREGDRLRDLHWPSLARTGRLIVKEFLDEYFVRIGIILDTELPRGEHRESFERRISMAAGIADSIAHRDYIIDLFAAGEQVHHFQIGRALAHLENLLELLACLAPTRKVDFERVEAHLVGFMPQLSSMVVLLRDWDTTRSRFCQALAESGLSVRIIVVRDEPLTIAPEQELTLVPATGEAGLVR